MLVVDQTMELLTSAAPTVKQRLVSQLFSKMLPLALAEKDQTDEQLMETFMEVLAATRGDAPADPEPEEDPDAEDPDAVPA